MKVTAAPTFFESIKRLGSWRYRLKRVWYRLKHRFWDKYTTVTPRSLDRSEWCDCTELLAHVSFEVLSRFIENECSPGKVDWYNESWNGKITVDGKEKWVRDEMQELYDWWHQYYLKEYPAKVDALYAEADNINSSERIGTFEQREDGLYTFNPRYKTQAAKDRVEQIYAEIRQLEADTAAELDRNLKRIIDIRSYMWT